MNELNPFRAFFGLLSSPMPKGNRPILVALLYSVIFMAMVGSLAATIAIIATLLGFWFASIVGITFFLPIATPIDLFFTVVVLIVGDIVVSGLVFLGLRVRDDEIVSSSELFDILSSTSGRFMQLMLIAIFKFAILVTSFVAVIAISKALFQAEAATSVRSQSLNDSAAMLVGIGFSLFVMIIDGIFRFASVRIVDIRENSITSLIETCRIVARKRWSVIWTLSVPFLLGSMMFLLLGSTVYFGFQFFNIPLTSQPAVEKGIVLVAIIGGIHIVPRYFLYLGMSYRNLICPKKL